MIIVLDSRRPSSLGVDVNLRLEAFLEHSRQLLSKCCVLGRPQLVDAPTGLIVPTSGSQGKMVQVVCRGRLVATADVSCFRLVDVQENGYGDGFGWKFLLDATLTATRIRSHPLEEIVVLTTDLMLAGEDLETEARFFSETSEALGTTAESARSTPRTPRISLVFVEVVGRSPSQTNSAAAAGAGDALKSDSLTAWSELQRLQDVYSEGGAFLLDLVDNTTAMFDSQLRCWLRDSSPRQVCSLRLPATETFSGVVIEVEITHYLLNHGRLSSNAPPAALLHGGFSNMQVVQGLRLDTLDQGLCRGDPLLCIPSHFRSSPQRSQANRKLFMAVCAELNERDTGLLLSLEHPSTGLQDRWLLVPQAPPTDRSASLRSETAGAAARGGLDNTNENAGADALVDKALLIRLATKEDVLEDGPVATTMSGIFGGTLSELSVERAAASASLEVLKTGTYNPLQHSSGLFEWLASQQRQQQARLNSGISSAATAAAAAAAVPHSARTAGGHGSPSVATTSGANRKHLHQGQQPQQPQEKQQQRKQRRQQRFSLAPTASLNSSSLKTSGSSRRATMGGDGGGGRGGAGGKSRNQQQRPAKVRQVSLKYAEASPQQQQQQQQQQQLGRGKTRAQARGNAGVRVGGGRGGGVAKSKSTALAASGGRPDKRGGTRSDGRERAKSSGAQSEQIVRRHSVSGGGGGGGGGGSDGNRDDDEGMML